MASTSVVANQNMHADGTLMSTRAVSAASVALSVTLPDGTTALPKQGAKVTTDSSGKFSMDYVPTAAGTYKFTASYSGSSSYGSSSVAKSFTVTAAQSQPVRWTWQASPATAIVGQNYNYTAKFEVQMTDGNWYGASTTRIDFEFTNPSGAVTTISKTTPADYTGIASVSFSPNAVGNWTVKCDWDHNNNIYAWDSSPVKSISVSTSTPVPPPPTPGPTTQNTITTLSSMGSVQTGSAASISGTLKTAAGTAISGASVSLQVTLPGGSKASPVTATTNSNGAFTYSYTPSAAGSYSVAATYAGSTSYNGSSAAMNFSATTPAPPPTPSTTYDYIVSGSQVKTSSGSVAYSGSSFTAALQWALSQGGKVTYVPAGSYTVTAAINVAGGSSTSPTTLIGDGDGTTGTVLSFTASSESASRINMNSVSNVALKKVRIVSGAIVMQVSGGTINNFRFEDVTMYQTNINQPNGKHEASFQMAALSKGVINSVSYYRCKVIGGGAVGFEPYGDFTGWVKNCYYEDCLCDHLGLDSSTRFNNWIVGFDIVESANVDTVTYVRCTAQYIWESGFHAEPHTANNVVIKDSMANNCGLKPASVYNSETGTYGPYFGCGFFCPNTSLFSGVHVTLTNCKGYANTKGDTYGGGNSLPDQ